MKNKTHNKTQKQSDHKTSKPKLKKLVKLVIDKHIESDNKIKEISNLCFNRNNSEQ